MATTARMKVVRDVAPPVRRGNAIAIERGVPMPTHVKLHYPFESMAVGDSFFIATKTDGDQVLMQSRICSSAGKFRRGECPHRTEVFTTRRVNGGVRCWRVS